MAAPTSTAESQPQVNGTNGVHGSNKRSPPERPKSPPAKRLRSSSKTSENRLPTTGSRKPPSRTAAKKGPEVAARKPRKLSVVREAEPAQVSKPEQQLKPYINQLPTPPQKQRPGLLPFVWGTGNFGQFGLGPEVVEEISKPRRQKWIEEKIDEGAFGEPGAGIEYVAAGGLHTVFIDEKGAVGVISLIFGFFSSNARSGHVARTTMLLLDVLRKIFLIRIIPAVSWTQTTSPLTPILFKL